MMDKQPISVDLVDDDPQTFTLLQQVLDQCDANWVPSVHHAYQDALKALVDYQPDFIIVEIGMRQGNGMEFVRKLRLLDTPMHILVYTHQDEQLYAERALRIGAHGYLMKPASTDELQAVIERIRQGELYVSPAIEAKLLRSIANQDHADTRDPERLLSNRELEIFVKIGEGLSSQQIANELGLSIKTIETHRAHIKRKLATRNAKELQAHAREWIQQAQTGA